MDAYQYNDHFIERFWEKVEIRDKGACWKWKAGKQSKGYGSIGTGNGKTALAHRVAYTLYYGDIPKGLVVMHICDNRQCCNPHHLKLGTIEENNQDAVAKRRHAFGEKNGKAKLTWEEIIELRTLYKIGEYSYKQLARKYNVSYSNVQSIISGKYWKLPLAT